MTEPVGVVFDIKEFAVYDGPGLRCTVFMKGCPLHCSWCHNPEGIAAEPEIMHSPTGSRIVGVTYTVSALVERLMAYAPVFAGGAGGVTFSGGEPLQQADFLVAVLARLRGKIHTCLQTTGCAPRDVFLEAAGLADLVYFDIKLVDSDQHEHYTGKDNAQILANLKTLDQTGKPYRLRMPLIPGVTDTPENYAAIRDFIAEELGPAGGLAGIDLLPYNRAAGGKYRSVDRKYTPGFNEDKPLEVHPEVFQTIVREVKVL